jgi:hypothetical protein
VQATKANKENLDLYLHTFLISELDGGSFQLHGSAGFSPGEEILVRVE